MFTPARAGSRVFTHGFGEITWVGRGVSAHGFSWLTWIWRVYFPWLSRKSTITGVINFATVNGPLNRGSSLAALC